MQADPASQGQRGVAKGHTPLEHRPSTEQVQHSTRSSSSSSSSSDDDSDGLDDNSDASSLEDQPAHKKAKARAWRALAPSKRITASIASAFLLLGLIAHHP